FVQRQTTVLLLPHVKRRFTDPMLPADIRHPLPALGLLQRSQNLLLAPRLLAHSPVLLAPCRGPSRSQLLNLSVARFSGFGSMGTCWAWSDLYSGVFLCHGNSEILVLWNQNTLVKRFEPFAPVAA